MHDMKENLMDLKPCPFCGDTDIFVEAMTFSSAAVVCAGGDGCGARGPECDPYDDADLDAEDKNDWHSGEAAARREWNKRAETKNT